MLFNLNAKTAKSNVMKYNLQRDKAELKDIIHSIDIASHHGYFGIEWQGKIRKANIYILKNYGYKVSHIAYSTYRIYW